MKLSIIISIILAALATVFAIENARPVEVTFFRWSFTGSLALVMALAFAAGAAAALLASVPGWIKTRLELSRLRKASKEKGPPQQRP